MQINFNPNTPNYNSINFGAKAPKASDGKKLLKQISTLPQRTINYDKFDFYYLRTLIDEGNSLHQIAEYYKEKVNVIRRVLTHFNLKTQQSMLIDAIKDNELIEALNSGKSQKEIAEMFFIDDPGALTPRIKKLGRSKVTKAKVDAIPYEKIEELLENGWNTEDIAAKFKVAYQYIRDVMKEHNLKTLRQQKIDKEVSVDFIVEMLNRGLSIKEIAERKGVGLSKISKIMKENNIKTLQQQAQEKYPTKKEIKAVISDKKTCATLGGLAKKFGLYPDVMNNLLKKYNLEIPKLVLPEVKDVEKLIEEHPRISADEIAEILGVEGVAVDKIVKTNKLKIWSYRDNKERGWSKIWDIQKLLAQGDSPTQIGEIYGLSSQGAKEMMIRLQKYCGDYVNLGDVEKLKFKKSPTEEEISSKIQEILNGPFNKTNIADIKTSPSYFLTKKLTKAFKISNMAFYNLEYRYKNLSKILEAAEEKLRNMYGK